MAENNEGNTGAIDDEVPAPGASSTDAGAGEGNPATVGPGSVGPATDLLVGDFSDADLDLGAEDIAGGGDTDPEFEHEEVPPPRPLISRPNRTGSGSGRVTPPEPPAIAPVRAIGSGRSVASSSAHKSGSVAMRTAETPSSSHAIGLLVTVGAAMFMAGALATSMIDKWPQSRLTDADALDESKTPSVTGLQPVGTKGAVWYERKFVPDLTAGSPQPEIHFPCPPPKVVSQANEEAQESKEVAPSPPKAVAPPPVKVSVPPPPKVMPQEKAEPVKVPEKPKASLSPPPSKVGNAGGTSNSIQYWQSPKRIEYVWCWDARRHYWYQMETLVTR